MLQVVFLILYNINSPYLCMLDYTRRGVDLSFLTIYKCAPRFNLGLVKKNSPFGICFLHFGEFSVLLSLIVTSFKVKNS